MTIKINTKPGASQHIPRGEKIVEYSSPSGGGLIAFREDGEGHLVVDLYRHDPSVTIRVGEATG